MVKRRWGHRVSEVRDYLRRRRNDAVKFSPDEVRLLEADLPGSWQKLIREHGHERVFMCLRCEMTIGGAMFYLREGHTA